MRRTNVVAIPDYGSGQGSPAGNIVKPLPSSELYNFRRHVGVGKMDPMSGVSQQRQKGGAPSRLRVFINYRRDDTWAAAQLVYDRLANSFGSENVFLDVQDLQPGMKWLEEIKSHRASCDVLLSLIGPHGVSIMKARERAAVAEPAEDYVRFEIEYALRPNSRIGVI